MSGGHKLRESLFRLFPAKRMSNDKSVFMRLTPTCAIGDKNEQETSRLVTSERNFDERLVIPAANGLRVLSSP